MCWLGPVVPWSHGPVVPWSRLAPVWPRASSPAWLRSWVPRSRIGGAGDPFGVPAWSRGPVWPPSGPVPRPQPGLGHGSQDPESVARETRSVCWVGPVVPWSRLAPVWPRASSPAWLRLWVPGSRIGGSEGPSVCPGGPVVPWSRLAPVWPRASSPAWLRLGVPGSRIGGSGDPFGVLAWSRGPVVLCGLSLALSLLFGVHAPVSLSFERASQF